MSELTPYTTSAEMHENVKACYEKMFKQVKADGMIYSGELVQMMLNNGINPYLNDGLHMSQGLGRYAIALLWYATLTGKDITDIPFNHFDEEVTSDDIIKVKQLVTKLTKQGE